MSRVFRGFVALLIFTSGCGGALTDTAVLGPTSTRCQADVTATSTSFPYGGGTATLNVGAARDCQWTASSDASWIVVTPASGQGAATVALSVRSNADARQRSAFVVVNDGRVELSQTGAPCAIELSGPGGRVAPAGGEPTLSVSTPTRCDWHASSSASWISFPAGASGSGPASLRLRIPTNHGGERRAEVTIGDASVTLVQAGSGPGGPAPSPPLDCSYDVDPHSAAFPAGGGQQQHEVITESSCPWEVTSTADWITVSTPTGTGRSTFRIAVSANQTPTPRTATVHVDRSVISVSQDALAAPPPSPPRPPAPLPPPPLPPPPPPPQPVRAEVEGTIGGLGGSCPGLSFTVRDQGVFTDESTRFKKAECGEIRPGLRVKVKGMRIGSGPIRAQEVEADRKH